MSRSIVENLKKSYFIFYVPNFEKVGSILLSASFPHVCVRLSAVQKKSNYGFEISYMDSSSNIAYPCVFSYLNYLPLPSYAPFKGSECNFVSRISQEVLKLGASNLVS